jgi:hypothetical protein
MLWDIVHDSDASYNNFSGVLDLTKPHSKLKSLSLLDNNISQVDRIIGNTNQIIIK